MNPCSGFHPAPNGGQLLGQLDLEFLIVADNPHRAVAKLI